MLWRNGFIHRGSFENGLGFRSGYGAHNKKMPCTGYFFVVSSPGRALRYLTRSFHSLFETQRFQCFRHGKTPAKSGVAASRLYAVFPTPFPFAPYHGKFQNPTQGGLLKFGSPGRDRTYDRRLTLVLLLLIGVDYIISALRSEALRPTML